MKTIALLLVGLATASASQALLDGNTTIYKIGYPKKGDCGQSTCAPASCKFPEKFGGFKEGTCASVGYTVADGQQSVKIPIIGGEQIYDLFKQPSDATAQAQVPVGRGCGFSCKTDADCNSPCGVCDGTACQAQAVVNELASDTTLYKISSGECGQATL